MDWVRWLFDASAFMTRDQCGDWPAGMRLAYIVSNAVIAISYFGIPVSLVFMHRMRRGDVIAHWVLVLFTAFIFGCGLTHIGDVLAFSWPAYRLFVLFAFFTAAVSLPTAVILPIELLRAAERPTPAEYHEVNRKLHDLSEDHKKTIEQQKGMIRELNHQIRNLEQLRLLGVWSAEQQRIMDRLYGIVQKGENNVRTSEGDNGIVPDANPH